MKKILSILAIFCIVLSLSSCDIKNSVANLNNSQTTNNILNSYSVNLSDIPEFNGFPYVTINNNKPDFDYDIINDYKSSFEIYSELDSLNRCGVAFSLIGRDIQPTEERGEIGMIKPSGWHTVKYDIVDGKYLYNRCHLIGYQLTGENANERNLITGTRYMNVEGMLPFENMIDDYLEKYDNHVLYRVTPIFKDEELVVRGVQLEAYSIEDKGKEVCFNVYCYNSQPGITIDYKTGESWLSTETHISTSKRYNESSKYVINKNSKKFHYINCSSVKSMAEGNKEYFDGLRSVLIKKGYKPCKSCNP